MKLLDESERQYGQANRSYTEYMLERLELSLATCSDILNQIQPIAELEEYAALLRELIDCLKLIYMKWEEYESILDSSVMQQSLSYCTQTTALPSGPGRPPFKITKDQLEYLASLGFKWNEIAVLVGVSRMTIYRYNNLCVLASMSVSGICKSRVKLCLWFKHCLNLATMMSSYHYAVIFTHKKA